MSTLLLNQRVQTKSDIAFPFITIALQVDPLMTSKEQVSQKIKRALDKVESELKSIDGIHDYMVLPAMNKVKSILNTLDNNVNNKSVVIFLAPFMEKIYYFDFLVKEKVVVGEPLNMRDLIRSKREEERYLVLNLHNEKSHIYLGEGRNLSLIVFNSSEQLKSHFAVGKERFLAHVDNVLTHILKTYSLPLISVGTEETLSLFSSVSKNRRELVEEVYSEGETENVTDVQQLVEPVIQDWEKLKEKYILMKLNKALRNKKAETGINRVCKAAREKRGKLLIVEKDFYYSFRSEDSTMCSHSVSPNGSLVNDATEEVMEKVLASGGKVEFVNSGVINDYMRIALIV